MAKKVGLETSKGSYICVDCLDDIEVDEKHVIYEDDGISFDCSQCMFYWNSVRKEFE